MVQQLRNSETTSWSNARQWCIAQVPAVVGALRQLRGDNSRQHTSVVLQNDALVCTLGRKIYAVVPWLHPGRFAEAGVSRLNHTFWRQVSATKQVALTRRGWCWACWGSWPAGNHSF